MNKSWYEKKEFLLKIDNIEELEIPDSLKKKIMELQLLNDIPLPYLVPHPKLLPYNSIRYFLIDSNWIWALLDGFCSMGRTNPKDILLDNQYIPKLFQKLALKKHSIRNELLAKKAPLKDMQLKEVSGILINSPLIRIYKGIEIRGFDSQNNLLETLRIEKLQDEIMICLFEGKLTHIIISEPKESNSYGFEKGNEQEKIVYIKNIITGESTKEKLSLKSNNRKINIIKFVEDLKTNLKIDKVNSAHIAVEFIKNQKEGEIQIVKE